MHKIKLVSSYCILNLVEESSTVMLYVIATIRNKHDKIFMYRILDFETSEVYIVDRGFISSNLEKFINISKENIESVLTGLPSIDLKGQPLTVNRRILLAKNINSENYLCANYTGKTSINTAEDIFKLSEIYGKSVLEFKEGTTLFNVGSHRIILKVDIPRVTSDKVIIKEYPEFISEVKEEYRKFTAKSKLLGLNMSFEYKILGHTVVLTSYTGTSEEVIIPRFVNVIGRSAFYNSNMNIIKVSLTDGLREIQNGAFKYNNIREVDIPATVQFICKDAFFDNMGLFKKVTIASNGGQFVTINKEKFRVSNKYTIIETQTAK